MSTGDRATLSVSRYLPATREAPGQARGVVTDLIQDLDGELIDDVRLVTSELVANVVLHSAPPPGGSMQLRLQVIGGVLRLELRYAGPPFHPQVTHPGLQSEGGRGLYIVDRLTDRWGVIADDGLRAWAEWDLWARGLRRPSDLPGTANDRIDRS